MLNYFPLPQFFKILLRLLTSSTYFAQYYSHFSSHEVSLWLWPVHFPVSCGQTGWQHENTHVPHGSRIAPFVCLWVLSVLGHLFANNVCYTGPSITNAHSYEWLCNFSRQCPCFAWLPAYFSGVMLSAWAYLFFAGRLGAGLCTKPAHLTKREFTILCYLGETDEGKFGYVPSPADQTFTCLSVDKQMLICPIRLQRNCE